MGFRIIDSHYDAGRGRECLEVTSQAHPASNIEQRTAAVSARIFDQQLVTVRSLGNRKIEKQPFSFKRWIVNLFRTLFKKTNTVFEALYKDFEWIKRAVAKDSDADTFIAHVKAEMYLYGVLKEMGENDPILIKLREKVTKGDYQVIEEAIQHPPNRRYKAIAENFTEFWSRHQIVMENTLRKEIDEAATIPSGPSKWPPNQIAEAKKEVKNRIKAYLTCRIQDEMKSADAEPVLAKGRAMYFLDPTCRDLLAFDCRMIAEEYVDERLFTAKSKEEASKIFTKTVLQELIQEACEEEYSDYNDVISEYKKEKCRLFWSSCKDVTDAIRYAIGEALDNHENALEAAKHARDTAIKHCIRQHIDLGDPDCNEEYARRFSDQAIQAAYKDLCQGNKQIDFLASHRLAKMIDDALMQARDKVIASKSTQCPEEVEWQAWVAVQKQYQTKPEISAAAKQGAQKALQALKAIKQQDWKRISQCLAKAGGECIEQFILETQHTDAIERRYYTVKRLLENRDKTSLHFIRAFEQERDRILNENPMLASDMRTYLQTQDDAVNEFVDYAFKQLSRRFDVCKQALEEHATEQINSLYPQLSAELDQRFSAALASGASADQVADFVEMATRAINQQEIVKLAKERLKAHYSSEYLTLHITCLLKQQAVEAIDANTDADAYSDAVTEQVDADLREYLYFNHENTNADQFFEYYGAHYRADLENSIKERVEWQLEHLDDSENEEGAD